MKVLLFFRKCYSTKFISVYAYFLAILVKTVRSHGILMLEEVFSSLLEI